MRMHTQRSAVEEMSHAYVCDVREAIRCVQARAPCLLGVNAWRAWRFARVPVRRGATPRYASLHFQRKTAFGGAGGGGGGGGGDGGGRRRCGVTITHTSTSHQQRISGNGRRPAGRPASTAVLALSRGSICTRLARKLDDADAPPPRCHGGSYVTLSQTGWGDKRVGHDTQESQ